MKGRLDMNLSINGEANHILNTPCLVSPMLLEAISTDSPNIFLVSSGRMTPSSHSLAVE